MSLDHERCQLSQLVTRFALANAVPAGRPAQSLPTTVPVRMLVRVDRAGVCGAKVPSMQRTTTLAMMRMMPRMSEALR